MDKNFSSAHYLLWFPNVFRFTMLVQEVGLSMCYFLISPIDVVMFSLKPLPSFTNSVNLFCSKLFVLTYTVVCTKVWDQSALTLRFLWNNPITRSLSQGKCQVWRQQTTQSPHHCGLTYLTSYTSVQMFTSAGSMDIVNDAIAAWKHIHYNLLGFQVVITLNYANTLTRLIRKMSADVFLFLTALQFLWTGNRVNKHKNKTHSWRHQTDMYLYKKELCRHCRRTIPYAVLWTWVQFVRKGFGQSCIQTMKALQLLTGN